MAGVGAASLPSVVTKPRPEARVAEVDRLAAKPRTLPATPSMLPSSPGRESVQDTGGDHVGGGRS